VPHNRIDLSAQAILDLLAEGGDKTTHATLDKNGARAIAYDMYNNGAGKSSNYIEYTFQTASEAMDNSPGTFACKQTTDHTGTTADLMIGKLAAKKAVSTTSGTKLKVYMDSLEGVACGDAPFQSATETVTVAMAADGTGSYGDSATAWGTDPYTASKGIYRQASCPTFGGGAATSTPHTYDGTVVCTSTGSTPVGESITYTMSSHTPKYGSRTLKGFSTAVQAKMIDGPTIAEEEAQYVVAAHGIGSYGDIHIQTAFAALKTGTANFVASGFSKFSSCHTCGDATEAACKANAVTDKATCEDDDGAAGTWTQGTALCKHTTTNAPMVNLNAANTESTTTTYSTDVTACATAGGKVTDYQIWSGPSQDVLLREIIQKMAVYTNAWLYTVHEFEDAIADCVGSSINNNDAGVHAWDEGVAFYTGTLAGTESIQNGGSKGAMLYALANKRCQNYKTCIGGTFTGQSQVNIDLAPLFTEGMLACNVGDCSKARVALKKIIPKMSVPLIQGTLRYAYKTAVLNGGPKEFGEGTAFMMSVIHRVRMCSAADAKIIYEALDVPTTVPGTYALGGTAGVGIAGYTAVKEAFERNYACMGVTCADIGDLYAQTTLLAAGCVDPPPSSDADGATTETEKEVLPTWAIVAIAAAGAMMVLFFGMMCAYKSSKDMTIKMYNDLKKEGAVGKV